LSKWIASAWIVLLTPGGTHFLEDEVIGHDRVSTLRLRHLFPAEVLDHARFYVEVPDEEGPGNFAESYRGGSWRSEVIDGVSFWYPKLSRRQVGIMQISGGPMVQGSPEPFTGPLVDAGWAKNANAVLKTLEINLHIGDALASVHAHAAGQVRVTRLTDGARQFVSLSCRAPRRVPPARNCPRPGRADLA
jgi:hypothetical protein